MRLLVGALLALLFLAAGPSYALLTDSPELLEKILPNPPVPPHVLVLSGMLMMSVAGASVSLWQYWTSTGRKWFLFGAFVWFVGVALKMVWAQLFNGPILGWLIDNTPIQVFLALGSFYIGTLTGVFEIGITAALALLWKRSFEDYDKAVAVGIGAGAIEAYLIGAFVLFVGPSLSRTPLLWLVGPAERLMTIICHAASRALVLLAIRTGQKKHFWKAFWLMSLLDTVAAFFHLSGYVDEISPWLMELAVLPFAIYGLLLLDQCRKSWPNEA